jgi:hypothetical protein
MGDHIILAMKGLPLFLVYYAYYLSRSSLVQRHLINASFCQSKMTFLTFVFRPSSIIDIIHSGANVKKLFTAFCNKLERLYLASLV